MYHRDGNKILYGEGFKVVSIAGCWLIEVLNTTRLLESNQYYELRQCLLLEKRFKYNNDVSLSPWIVSEIRFKIQRALFHRSLAVFVSLHLYLLEKNHKNYKTFTDINLLDCAKTDISKRKLNID